jgi:seryl-tRNA synthetase
VHHLNIDGKLIAILDLVAQGVEVVKADLNDVESLKEALKVNERDLHRNLFNIHRVVMEFFQCKTFGNYLVELRRVILSKQEVKHFVEISWFFADEEVKQGMNLADAAKVVGIKHFVHRQVDSSHQYWNIQYIGPREQCASLSKQSWY